MKGSNKLGFIYALGRTVVWFASVLLAVAFFSLCLGGIGSVMVIFQVTLKFALPVALLALPIVIAFGNLGFGKTLRFLLFGSLIGPVVLIVWFFFFQWRGDNAHEIWFGEPPGIGGIAAIVLSSIVGFVTALSYAMTLKVFSRSRNWGNRGE